VNRSFFWLNLVLGICACLVVAFLGSALVVPIFGDGYAPSKPLLQILAIALPFHYVNSWAGNGLVASGRLSKVLFVQGATAAVNVVGNLLLIPAIGARGSALVTVGSEIICSLTYVCVLAQARSATLDASPRT
jgi:O-antigen/teichoic acid export membrane protein